MKITTGMSSTNKEQVQNQAVISFPVREDFLLKELGNYLFPCKRRFAIKRTNYHFHKSEDLLFQKSRTLLSQFILRHLYFPSLANSSDVMRIDNKTVKEIKKFVYLGSRVAGKEVTTRTNTAEQPEQTRPSQSCTNMWKAKITGTRKRKSEYL